MCEVLSRKSKAEGRKTKGERQYSMKKMLFLALAIMAATACKREKTEESVTTADKTETIEAEKDSTLWGHLGEDTGMGTLQFVTDQGDTLSIFRTDQLTGEDGLFLGEVRNYTDRFAITLKSDGETLLTAINTTQLAQRWQTKQGTLTIKVDGTVTSQGLPYNGWKLWNGHILLSSEHRLEAGTATRIDTMDIAHLDEDSLLIQDHIKRFLKFYNPI